MKNFYLILLSALVFISCSNDENELSILNTFKSENGLSYNESIDNWTKLKETNGKSYIYEATFVSWAGFGSVTEIKVEEGNVTSRVYEAFEIDGQSGTRTIVDTYTENSDELGSHESGAKPLTIDELYTSCASDYLIIDQKNNTLYFETDINGTMTLCGFVPNSCVDDCYQGIRISSFIWIN